MSRAAIAALAVLAAATGSVVKPPATGDAGAFELLILHNNDMHARFEQTSQLSGTCTTDDREAGKCYGGFPRVAYVVKEARKAAAAGTGPPVLYLNAGDTYTGTAWFTIYKWKIAAEFVNALKPDAVSLGNHEFDNGVSGLTPFIENLTSPVLAANLNLKKVPELQAEKNLMNSVIFQVNDVKVGVIGYLTPETKVLAIRNDVEYIDEVVALREEVAKLKNMSVNILIALGHSGFKKDLEIAKQVEDIDLVIGGHTNTFLWNGTAPDSERIDGPYPTLVKQASGRIVPVIQAYAYTKYLGKLHLVFNNKGEIKTYDGQPVLLDKTIPQDPDVLVIIEKYRGNVTKIAETVVGNTSVSLDKRSCRFGECNLANLITDALIYRYASEYKGKGWTDAPIAVIQRGGIRAPIAPLHLPAPVTQGDLIAVLPFEGNVMKVSINGSDLITALERSITEYTASGNGGHFLHYSGIKITYDLKRKPGHQVVDLLVRCGQCDVPKFEPLNKTMEYNILMSSYLSNGGNGYSVFSTLPVVQMSYSDLDATTTYVKTHSPIYAAIEDRITILNPQYASGASIFLPNLIFVVIAGLFRL